MTMISTADLAGYEAALEGTAFLSLPEANILRLDGPDRVDYLHRQTTNDIHLLRPERAVLTILTSPAARILDVLLLVHEPDAIGIITVPGRGPATAEFFQSRIFFMDKVTVSDVSAEVAQLELEGPQAGETLAGLGLAEAPALDGVATFDIDGQAVRVIGCEGAAGSGYRLLIPTSTSEALSAALKEAGATSLSAESYETLRVEAGLPGPHELSEEYTPLEVGLDRAVSSTKGCYTGQEVIARQLTYDKVTKTLVGLKGEAPFEIGANLRADDKPAGSVTSAAQSPRYGHIARAVVKRPHDEPGTMVTVSGAGGEVSAEVVALPFGS